MTPERWAEVTALFDAACQQPADSRETWLDTHCDDVELRTEVRAMLHAYDTDPEFLEQPTDVTAALDDVVNDGLVGRRLGTYRLVRQIGRGGQGVVYEARRDDEEFDRRTAIKILPAWTASAVAERFRFERRVLAGLDHPGIARLLDAGTTTDGVTYFVMEYVEGQPVTQWCAARALSVRDRVALVEQICDAVAYAHAHLVVHRDLKPANIFVDAKGRPKLLDFGIAAILSEDSGVSAGMTRTGHHSFTPEYASPEQIRGERVSTASDVYSLGVLLYVLLAGRHPYSLQGLPPLEAMRVVCDVDPPPPSAVADAPTRALLRGDLDAIMGKALRKAPDERYRTVAELAADLQAWRDGRPVSASPASWAYRTRRFVSRHRLAVAATVAVALALVGGATATAWQARIARRERDKAQNRFRQVEEFSRSLLFDVHSALMPLPGATEPRRLLLNRAVQFLDGLAADAGNDDALKLELATGYQQLANVQGNQLSDNVGDAGGAAANLNKAMALAQEVRARQPGAIEPLVRAVRISGDAAAVHTAQADAEARTSQAVHEDLVRELERVDVERRFVGIVAAGYSNIGRLHADNEEFDAAEAAYRSAIRMYDAMPPAAHVLGDVRDHAFALKRLGGVLLRAGKFEESEQRYREALRWDEESIRLDDRPQTRYDITFTLSDLALVMSRQGHWSDAEAMWRRALELRLAASAADPKNVRPLSGVATLYGRLGGAAHARNDLAQMADHYRAELGVRQQVLALTGLVAGRTSEIAWTRLNLANALLLRADASPRDPARDRWVAEARQLVRATSRNDGAVSVTAGSKPGFLELFDRLTSRLATR